jgi:hypothetical protein
MSRVHSIQTLLGLKLLREPGSVVQVVHHAGRLPGTPDEHNQIRIAVTCTTGNSRYASTRLAPDGTDPDIHIILHHRRHTSDRFRGRLAKEHLHFTRVIIHDPHEHKVRESIQVEVGLDTSSLSDGIDFRL